MKIIILGAGQVGSTLAEQLVSEQNDVTLVDTDAARLEELQERLDIRTVQGRASYPNVLRRAGADDADMIIAVTNSDETNMLACKIADTLFQTQTCARTICSPAKPCRWTCACRRNSWSPITSAD